MWNDMPGMYDILSANDLSVVQSSGKRRALLPSEFRVWIQDARSELTEVQWLTSQESESQRTSKGEGPGL